MTDRYEFRIIDQEKSDAEWLLIWISKSMPYTHRTDVEIYKNGKLIKGGIESLYDEDSGEWLL